MKCPIGTLEEGLILAHAARQLHGPRETAFEEHVRGCSVCAAALQQQRAVWEAMDLFEAAPISPDFDRKLYARIADEVGWFDRLLRSFQTVFARKGLPIAAAATVTLLATLLLRQPSTAPPSQPSESAQVETVAPEQAEEALRQMELLRQFSQIVDPEAAQPKM